MSLKMWDKENLKNQNEETILKHIQAINKYLNEDYKYGSDEYNLALSYSKALFVHLSDLHEKYYPQLLDPLNVERYKAIKNYSTNSALMRLNNLNLGFFNGVESARKLMLLTFGNYRDLVC